jgi:ribosome-binding factor A
MAKDYPRARRIEQALLRALSELIRREVKDPEVGAVTLTAVQVSKDLSHGTVYFLPFEASRDRERVAHALNRAGGFLRHALKDHMKLHHIPELKFVPDESIERMARLSALISSAVASDAERHPREDGGSDSE